MLFKTPGIRALAASAMVAAFSVSVSAPSVAWAEDAVSQDVKDKLIDAIEAKYKDVKSLKATFTQTAKSELFGEEKVDGKLVVKTPSKMRWSFGSEKLFITDGSKMWIVTEEDKQAIVYDEVSYQGNSAGDLLTSLDKLEQSFKVDVLASTAEGHDIALFPKGDDQFKKVKLSLSGDLAVRQVVITDAFDNITEIAFRDVEMNATVDDSLFTYVPEQGFDVIQGN